MKNKNMKKIHIETITLIILVIFSLVLAVIDAFRVQLIIENNISREVYSIFMVDNFALALTIWFGIIILFTLVYLLIVKKIRYKKQKEQEDSDMVFNSGNEERNVSACDYRKWSK